MTFLRSATLAAGLALLTSPLAAEVLSDADSSALQTRISSFNTAFAAADFDEVMTTMPPRVLNFIAERSGMTPEALLEAMVTQTEAAMETITVEDFGMSLEDATTGVTDQGDTYAILPTTVLMDIQNVGKMRGVNSTLALKDEGKWYLIRVDNEQQLQLLRTVYPGFENIDFPIGTLEPVE